MNELPKARNARFFSPGLVAVVAAYILSRAAGYALGIRFDAKDLGSLWQYIDPALLRTHLLQSVYYLHAQPPLFNLFLGVVLKTFDGWSGTAFNALYVALGLGFSIALFRLMIRLGVTQWLAALATILFVISPACVLYENWLFYTYPLAALLVFAALLLNHWLVSPRTSSLALCLAALAAVVLTRSLFHLLWIVLIVVALLLIRRVRARAILVAAALPLLIVLALYVKNWLVFGSFASSSWLGMSLAKFTTLALPDDEAKQLVNDGRISGLSTIQSFSPLAAYRPFLDSVKPTGIPVLDEETKPSGEPNFNDLAFLQVARIYERDARYIIRTRPHVYLTHLFNSWGTYFEPATNYAYVEENRRRIAAWDRVYNVLFAGSLSELLGNRADELYGRLARLDLLRIMGSTAQGKFGHIGVFLFAVFLFVMVAGPWMALRALRRKPMDLPFAATMLFIWFNLLYVSLVCNALERGENNRIRFMVDPLILTILAVSVDRLGRRIAGRKTRKTASAAIRSVVD